MARRQYPNLAKAPIVEALVDFRVSGPSERAIEALQQLASSLADRYPHREDVFRAQLDFSVGPAPQEDRAKSTQHQIGYRLRGERRNHIAVLTSEGFTVSRLRPYDSWKSLRSEAQSLWEPYREAVQPTAISRVALRYINRLDLPRDLRDFRDYLTAPPDVPPRLSQILQAFLTRIVVPLPRVDGTAIITQQFEPRTNDEFASVILDIDVFKTGDFEKDDSTVWTVVDELRTEKNMIFFESITEQMEELCS